MYCRNCGEGLSVTVDKTCSGCGANAVKATSFCRYCGKATGVQDLTCPNCGSAIKPIPGAVKALNKDNPALLKLSKIVNLTLVTLIVTAYIVFSLPPKVTKPITLAASDVVVATTGYTEIPLHSISAYPPQIPQLRNFGLEYVPPGVTVNTTQQLTVYAIYKNLTAGNATKAVRTEVVTANSTYRSSNEKVATVTSSGLVKAIAIGAANVTISYTAVPGSANMSSAAQGKIPITVTARVLVQVR